MEQLTAIALDKLDWHPAFQVRQLWDPQDDPTLADLRASLDGPEGLIHPILVVPVTTPTTFGHTYTLIAGHRRVVAARQLGWRTILARVLPPADLDDFSTRLQLLAIALRENTARQDLAPADRREALRRLKELYQEVYPDPHHSGWEAEDSDRVAFPRWAARVTQIPLRTIFQDLRLAALGPSAAPASLLPAPDAPVTVRVHYVTATGQALTTVLHDLAATLRRDGVGAGSAATFPANDPVPQTQYLALQQTLQTLQAALAAVLAVWQAPPGGHHAPAA